MNGFSCCPGLMRAVRVFAAALLVAGTWWLFARDSAATEPNSKRVELKAGAAATSSTRVEEGRYYGMLVSALNPADFQAGDSVLVTYKDPAGGSLTKTLHAGDLDLYVTVRAGATGYLLKRSLGSELPLAVREVMNHRFYVTPLLTKDLVGSLVHGPHVRRKVHQLTPRQREVLQLLAEGRSMK